MYTNIFSFICSVDLAESEPDQPADTADTSPQLQDEFSKAAGTKIKVKSQSLL